MKDFVAVLAKFKRLGRHGLSQQALSEICGRAISFEELKETPDVHLTFCEIVETPVFFKKENGVFYGWWSAVLRCLIRHLEEEFPWPKFKGMSGLKGQRTTGLSKEMVAVLRKTAAGTKKRK